MASHPFELLDYHGDPVEIDAEIVPLMRLLWAHGLETFNSCQDFAGDGRVWVEFDGWSASHFVNVVAGQDDELRGHILHSAPREAGPPGDLLDAWALPNPSPQGITIWLREHGWTYSVLPWPDWGDDPDEIRFLVSVHFPRHDLPAVVAALEAATREAEAA